MKPGKIIEIIPTGTWKDLFKFDYKVEDVETKETHVGGALHKTEKSPYHVDMILNYEIIVNDKGFSNIKFQNEKPAFSAKSNFTQRDPEEEKKRQGYIIRQVSMRISADLVKSKDIELHEILVYADIFNNWIRGDVESAKLTIKNKL